MTTPSTPEPDEPIEPSTAREPSARGGQGGGAARVQHPRAGLRLASGRLPADRTPDLRGTRGHRDHLLGTSWLVGAGIVGGMALSLYLIWFRYGTH